MGLNGGGGRYKLCHTQKTADSEVHIGQNTPPPPPEHIKAIADLAAQYQPTLLPSNS